MNADGTDPVRLTNDPEIDTRRQASCTAAGGGDARPEPGSPPSGVNSGEGACLWVCPLLLRSG